MLKKLGGYDRNDWVGFAGISTIDDIMMFPMKKEEANAFFNLINTLHEKASVIITTNKAPTEWAQRLDDDVLATAILDRLMYRCQIIKLTGEQLQDGQQEDDLQ